jgi:hypothetical protein
MNNTTVHLCSCGKPVRFKIGEKFFFLVIKKYVCELCLDYKMTYPSSVKWYERLEAVGQIEAPAYPKL